MKSQLSFIPQPTVACGGSLNNTRQSKRTLSSKRQIHLVLKAREGNNLFKSRAKVNQMVTRYAKRFGIKIYRSSVQRDHIHIVIRIPCRNMYVRFIRSLTSMISRLFGKGLWIFRPYTRVGSWGKDFKNLLSYLFRNEMEIYGVWEYKPRGQTPTRLES